MFRATAVDSLIALGRSFEIDSQAYSQELGKLKLEGWHINKQPLNFWKPVAARLSDTDLVSLIKGLTLAETQFNWLGGSAASCIWVFRIFMERSSSEAIEGMADCVGRHTLNHYLPFGSTRIRSYEIYRWRNSSEYKELSNRHLQAEESRKQREHEAAKSRRETKSRAHCEAAA